MNRPLAAACLVVLMVAMAGMPVLSAKAMVLPTSPWDDYWPWQMTISYPQASSYTANMTALHGSSAALASTSPIQTTFWANASDTFTCTVTIQYPVAASGVVEVSVFSDSKFKDFGIPFSDETTVTLSWVVTLEPQNTYPDAAQIAAQTNLEEAGQFQQLHNDNVLTQSVFSDDFSAFMVMILLLVVIVCILGWRSYEQDKQVRELREVGRR